MILLNFGWMVDLAMNIFEFLIKFLVFWHPWHSWVCIRSDLKPLFETDLSDSSYSENTTNEPPTMANFNIVAKVMRIPFNIISLHNGEKEQEG